LLCQGGQRGKPNLKASRLLTHRLQDVTSSVDALSEITELEQLHHKPPLAIEAQQELDHQQIQDHSCSTPFLGIITQSLLYTKANVMDVFQPDVQRHKVGLPMMIDCLYSVE